MREEKQETRKLETLRRPNCNETKANAEIKEFFCAAKRRLESVKHLVAGQREAKVSADYECIAGWLSFQTRKVVV
jgi:ssDNA-binding Zn-finger/Zn-ribbon topoisomerase 1